MTRRSSPTARGVAPQEAGRAARSARGTPHPALRLSCSQQHLALIETLDAHIATLDARIETRPMTPFAEAAALVQTMPGVAERAAQAILAETGVDMDAASRRPPHLASWARLCPGNHESAGKRRPSAPARAPPGYGRRCNRPPGRPPDEEELLPRALLSTQARGGAKKAIVAVQHAMIVALWHMLKHHVAHHDLGADYFDRRNTERLRRHHVRRLERLGYNVVLVDRAA